MANLRQSVYGGISEFLIRSEKQAQFTAAAAAGAAVFGGYGVLKGAVSDNTTMFGGGVDGATFGAVAGAGLAQAVSGQKGKAFRNVLRNLNNKMSGVDLAGEDFSRRSHVYKQSPQDWEAAARAKKSYKYGGMEYNVDDLIFSKKMNRGYRNVAFDGKKDWEQWFDTV